MAKRKSAGVSMDPQFEALAKQRAQNLGLTFSAYINQLIRADLQERKPLSLCEEPQFLARKKARRGA
jgi:hypothetical protein